MSGMLVLIYDICYVLQSQAKVRLIVRQLLCVFR